MIQTPAEPASSTRRPVAQPPALLSETELLRQYHVNGDRRARDEVIRRLLPLARRLAGRYAGNGCANEDLFQVASLGLVKAVDRFDLSRGTSLKRFAVPTILGELKRHVRDTRWALHVPRELQERALEVSGVATELTASHGAPPSLCEVAEETGLDVEEVTEAMLAFTTMDPESIDAPVVDDGGAPILHEARLATDEVGYDHVEARVSIEPGVEALSEEERKVLVLRYVADLTQSEIGRRLGISQMGVSRTLRRALGRIRDEAHLPLAA